MLPAWHAELLPELAAARQAIANGALAAVATFEPTGWTMVRFRLWPQYRESFDRAGMQTYEVGHVSLPS